MFRQRLLGWNRSKYSKKIREEMSPHARAAHYRQQPQPSSGEMIEPGWCELFNTIPDNGKGGCLFI